MDRVGDMPRAVRERVDAIDDALPQTQCTKCGFDGCRPYAAAIVAGEADINRCPPGGQAGVQVLARLSGKAEVALDATRGLPGPLSVAIIDEEHCIGCTLCIQACPVDAILGANKFMHTVLAASCTGCELCVAPCPVDCIRMEPLAPAREWTRQDAQAARARHHARQHRLARIALAKRAPAAAPPASMDAAAAAAIQDPKRAAIAAALARARARRAT